LMESFLGLKEASLIWIILSWLGNWQTLCDQCPKWA
jgi:hypothetical protein